LNTANHTTLNLYLHPSYIAYSIYDHEEYEYHAPIAELFKDSGETNFYLNTKNWLLHHSKIIDAQYQRVIIGIHSSIFSVFDQNIENRNQLFAVLTGFQEDKFSIYEDPLTDDFIISYVLHNDIIELVKSYFPEADILYGDSGFLKSITHKISENKCVVVNVQPQSISIAYKNQDKISFYNQFTYTTKEDLLYYLLWTYEELQLDTHSFPLLVYGWIEETAPLFGILYNYIRNVQIASVPFLIKSEDTTYPTHYFLPLLGLRL
jgi:hypothetical protein